MRTTFYFQKLVFCKRLSIYRICAVFVNVFDDQPSLEHVVWNWRQNWLLRHLAADYSKMKIKDGLFKKDKWGEIRKLTWTNERHFHSFLLNLHVARRSVSLYVHFPYFNSNSMHRVTTPTTKWLFDVWAKFCVCCIIPVFESYPEDAVSNGKGASG